MSFVCNKNMCTGCMACVNICKKNAITIMDSLDSYNAEINEDICIDCGFCKRVCPNLNSVERKLPQVWKEGWSSDTAIREHSSSGGIASALIYSFIQSGEYVAACLFKDGEFVFDITNSIQEVDKFAGSKYVKSNPKYIYRDIVEKLNTGNKVLFIGLPCQVAALKNITRQQQKLLYTVDLICHGTPSPKLLHLFLKEKGINLNELEDIHFRKKTMFGLRSMTREISAPRVVDMYTHAFLNCVDYTENCYNCQYASLSRVSDITLGDSWGSELDEDEKEKGVSLVLCQTDKGAELLDNSDLKMFDVDLQKAIESNRQLQSPSKMPEQRKDFFKGIDNGFERIMGKMYPKLCFKNFVKTILCRLGIRL